MATVPFTAILKVAGKHGVKALGTALSGNLLVGDIAADLFSALTQTEGRLAEKLSGIEAGLAESLEQTYSVALNTGLRLLLDLNPAEDPAVRRAETGAARHHFVKASTSARTDLQRIIAERYLVLTALMLNNPLAARHAFDRFQLLATELLLLHASASIPREGSATAPDSAQFIVQNLFRETAPLAELVGYAARSAILTQDGDNHAGLVCPDDSDRICQAGVISVSWHTRHSYRESRHVGLQSNPVSFASFAADVTVRLQEPLTQSLTVGLELETDPVKHILELPIHRGDQIARLLATKQVIDWNPASLVPRIAVNLSEGTILFPAALLPG